MGHNQTRGSLESPLSSLFGDNVLLSPLGPRIAFRDLPTKLANRALDDYDLSGFDLTEREELLVLYKQNFVPTSAAIDAVSALQNLHREHYWQRHPHNPAVFRNRSRIAELVQTKDFDPKSMPWLDTSASGMIIKGITGTGKTAIINRYTAMLSGQVCEHNASSIPGFDYIKQIVWLKVDMSSDGSRRGFLTSILLEVDRLLDTSYGTQYAGRFSVDRLAVVVGAILSTHFCGMLIIEEIQEKNFNNSKWRNDLTTFFLRVLNFGVPVVLIGNPRGFYELERSSQNVRRLSSGGVFELNPSLSGSDIDFINLVNETIPFNVMERQSPQGRSHFRDVAYRYTGGVTDFVVRLNVESQRIALHCGHCEVLPKHIDAAFASRQLQPNRDLITGLVRRDPNSLIRCTDVPVERFIELWACDNKASRHLDTVDSAAGEIRADIEQNGGPHRDRRMRELASPLATQQHPLVKKLKTEQTKKTNKHTKAIEQQAHLAPGDIRNGGSAESLIAGLRDLLQKADKSD